MSDSPLPPDAPTAATPPHTPLRAAFAVDDRQVQAHLDHVVRQTVEQTLNALLDAEADALCGGKRYERSPDRVDTRAGTYDRTLHTTAGEVTLKVPRLRSLPFETQIIERYRRRQSSVEEALVEMYLAGVSTRRVEDITEALWGTRVSASTVSELNQKVYERIDAWRGRPIAGEYPYLFVDGIWLKRTWGGEVRNVAVLVAVGVSAAGHRDILAVQEGSKEDGESWLTFFRHVKERGLRGVRMVTSDKCLGIVEAAAAVFPDATWQRCVVHFERNILSTVPREKMAEVATMVKAIYASEDRPAAEAKAEQVAAKLDAMRLSSAAKVLRAGVGETLCYFAFPQGHWRRIRTNNLLERLMKEIRRRTRVVGAFPDGHSAVMLAAARLRHVAGTDWGERAYLDMKLLSEQDGKTKTAGEGNGPLVAPASNGSVGAVV
ncbi:IS256 family transposase [Limnoglobus roseus]|nr:IS256 family transposase [Limnoglobus roseus]